MKTKTLILVAGLVVLALVASATFVLAQHGPSSSYYSVTGPPTDIDDAQWNEMRTYMEQRWGANEYDGWWQEMRELMEQRWGNTQSDGWWNEMRQYMEERCADQDGGTYNRYEGYRGYGGYGGCGGCRW